MASLVKIAVSHNNAAGLVSLNLLSPPLFSRYVFPGGLQTEWHDWVTREWSGDRLSIPIGRPWAAWLFFQLDPADLTYLLDTFGTQVTIRTLDKRANTYKNFNATLIAPDLVDQAKSDWGFWYDVRVEFHDLVEI